ncbi:GroES-like protein [Jackrogersella minutella]|nr:GroES-like protein [Jackrogersella minutella]
MSSFTLPDHQSAIVCISKTSGANIAVSPHAALPVPLASDQVLVQTMAVALNPCDWKMPDNFPAIGSTGGSDFAGTIVALGVDVQEAGHPDLAIGDRVCGAVHGFNPANRAGGCFSEYVAATADILMKIPLGVSWEEAAAIGGTGIATLGVAFYGHLKIGFSPEKPASGAEAFPVLVYGGGTATGTMAIQLLKASGLRPLAVCSLESAGLALSYGAEKAFNYNSPNCSADIKSYTKGRLNRVLDIIANPASIKLCYEAMGRLGGTYVGLELLLETPPRQLVKASWVMGQTIFGKELQLSGGYERPAIPAHRDLGKKWFAEVQELWHKNAIKSHPVNVGPEKGLDAVLKGIDLLRRGAVAREKLVYFLR